MRLVDAVLQRDDRGTRVQVRLDRIERCLSELRLDREEHKVEHAFDGIRESCAYPRVPLPAGHPDDQPGVVHGIHVVGRDVDEQHVLTGLRHASAHDPADRAGSPHCTPDLPHSGLIPAAFTTFANFGISVAMIRASSSGVLVAGSRPCAVR